MTVPGESVLGYLNGTEGETADAKCIRRAQLCDVLLLRPPETLLNVGAREVSLPIIRSHLKPESRITSLGLKSLFNSFLKANF